MSVSSARKTTDISKAEDPKQAILDAVGDLSEIEVFHNQILVGTYVRPNITRGGILRPDTHIKEDEYQGKVGLVLKKGPTAFLSTDEESFENQDVKVGDWVVYRIGDGWPLTIRDTACRILTDRTIRIRIQSPDIIY